MENNIKEKLYQMFILGMEGEFLENNSNLKKALKTGLGGVIFFSQNIKGEKNFKKLVTDIKNESAINPFLSIDQEGGRVERTENIYNGKKYLSARDAANKGLDYLKNQTESIASDLNDFGINLNFAPVLDVNTNPNNPIIGERAFSNDTDAVIKCGQVVVDTYMKNGIITCGKHFPGHGDASVDSHISLPKIDMNLEEMEKFHIRPFKEVSVPMIMVAHLHCLAFDKDEIPSSLSSNVIGYLKNELNYKGLIITDDMVMGGVLGLDPVEACISAIKAGVDILLYRDSNNDTIEIIESIAKIAEVDVELTNNIESSYFKILSAKEKLLKY